MKFVQYLALSLLLGAVFAGDDISPQRQSNSFSIDYFGRVFDIQMPNQFTLSTKSFDGNIAYHFKYAFGTNVVISFCHQPPEMFHKDTDPDRIITVKKRPWELRTNPSPQGVSISSVFASGQMLIDEKTGLYNIGTPTIFVSIAGATESSVVAIAEKIDLTARVSQIEKN